jgi:hypothetical protein
MAGRETMTVISADGNQSSFSAISVKQGRKFLFFEQAF